MNLEQLQARKEEYQAEYMRTTRNADELMRQAQEQTVTATRLEGAIRALDQLINELGPPDDKEELEG